MREAKENFPDAPPGRIGLYNPFHQPMRRPTNMYRILFAVILFASAISTAQAGDAAAGKAHFDKLCVSCHGAGGKGDGPVASALKPPPSNLTVSTLSETDKTNII